MADPIVTPHELLIKLTEGRESDFFRAAMLSVLRELMEVEISQKTGASLGERTPERLTMRNGYRERRLDTRVGSLSLPDPALRRRVCLGRIWGRMSSSRAEQGARTGSLTSRLSFDSLTLPSGRGGGL